MAASFPLTIKLLSNKKYTLQVQESETVREFLNFRLVRFGLDRSIDSHVAGWSFSSPPPTRRETGREDGRVTEFFVVG